MANSRDIELIIKSRDLASKSVKDIASSVDGLGNSVAKLGPKSELGEVKLSELTAVAKELEGALKGLAANQALVERFKLLNSSLADSSKKLTELKTRADSTRDALARSAAPTSDLQKNATAAQAAFSAQEKVTQRLAGQLDKLRESANRVGLEFNDLDTTERRITETVNKAAAAYNAVNKSIDSHAANVARAAAIETQASVAMERHAQNIRNAALETQALATAEDRGARSRTQNRESVQSLTGAYSGLGASASRLAQALGFSQTGERRSLSFFQRLRGEVLAVTASYVGLFAAVQGINKVLEVTAKRTSIENTFGVAFGSDSAAQLKFISEEADRLGFRFLTLAENYGKFAIAARSSNVSLADTQTIFQSFTEVSRALNLSNDRVRLVFTALEQIMSKGKITAEELRGQLGEQLPGVMGVFAKSLGVSQAELNKLITTTGLSSKFLLNLAVTYRDQFAGTVASASKTPQAAMERFQTQLDKLADTISKNGFADQFTLLLGDLTKFFQSQDGETFVKGLTTLMVDLVKVVRLLVENYREIGAALLLVFGAKSALAVTAFAREMGVLLATVVKLAPVVATQLVSGFGALRNTVLALSAAIPALGVALSSVGVTAAGFLGFQFGTLLYGASTRVRQFGVVIVAVLVTAFSVVNDAWVALLKKITNGDDFTKTFLDRFAGRLAQLKDQYELAGQEIAKEDEKLAARATGFARGGRKAVDIRNAKATAREQALEVSAELQKVATKAQQEIQDKLSKLRAESLKKDATNVEEYRKALVDEFAELYRQIKEGASKFGADNAARLKAQLDSIIELRVQQAANKFSVEEVRAKEAEINDLLTTRNKLIEQANKLRSVEGDSTIDKRVAGISAEFNGQIEARARALLADIEKLPDNVKKSLRTVAGDLEVVIRTQLQNLTDLSEIDKIREEYEKIRDLTQSRTNALQLQKALFASHLIDQKAYEASVAKINNHYEQIVPRADELLQKIASSTTLTEEQRQAIADIVIALTEIRDTVGTIDPFAARVAQTLDSWAESLGGVVSTFARVAIETRSIGDGFRAAREAAADFFLGLAADILKAIVKAQILKALLALNNGGSGGAIGTIISALSKHSGGLTSTGPRRPALAEWFIGAQRLHNGGVPGLRSGEVPTILKTDEEVLTRNDPRHVANGGGGAGGVQIFNQFDVHSVAEAVGQTPAFRRAVFNSVSLNKRSFRQAQA